MIKKIANEITCAVDYAFRRVGGKYKGRILWHLHNQTIIRYGALRKTLSDITPKMLTQTLRELEDDNLINRKVYHEVPPKVEYSLTEVGTELIPFINHLRQWGTKQIEKKRKPLTMTNKQGTRKRCLTTSRILIKSSMSLPGCVSLCRGIFNNTNCRTVV